MMSINTQPSKSQSDGCWLYSTQQFKIYTFRNQTNWNFNKQINFHAHNILLYINELISFYISCNWSISAFVFFFSLIKCNFAYKFVTKSVGQSS